ncbi:MAG: hypothetical protein RR630_02630 [Coprobacillus sp.]
MFENTSKKIKICAYVFFIGGLLNHGARAIRLWFELGRPSSLIIETILDTFNTAIMYLVVSLFIYGFGKIVQHFESLDNKHEV